MDAIKNKGKQKMLIFHPVLATYRIDQFNFLSDQYDLEVVFLFDQMWNFIMDQNRISEQCKFKISYLLTGPKYKGRLFRFGMYNKIRQVKPDIILGYEYSFTTQYLILLKKLGFIKQRVGSFIDDSLDICLNVQSKIRKIARNNTVRSLDFLVVMSNEVANFYSVNFNLEQERVIVSPILQSPDRLRSNPEVLENIARSYVQNYRLKDKRVLLFVGRFIPEKALDLFIKTVSHILRERDDIKLVLVGEGREYDNLKSIISEESLEERIIFPGKFQFEELYAWYTTSSGFVLPSLSETFGAVVNEALIFGLPVMCSKYAGASTLINSNNGLVFNPLDNEETSRKLVLFFNKLEPVSEVNLANKPTLIFNHKDNLFKEWGKLAYV
jgi:glycosyltransferase involved in cell wall biosynthesis